MQIRLAQKKDITELVKLVSENPDKLLPRNEVDFLELLETTHVAEEDGRLVGCATLEIYSQKIAEIRNVAVKTDLQKKGIGRSLIKAAVEDAQKRHIQQILVVTSSPEYFAKLNFGPCLNEKYALFWNGKSE